MYPTVFGTGAYDFFIMVAIIVTFVASLFLFPFKHDVWSLHSKRIVYFVSGKNNKVGTVLKYVFITIESVLMACALLIASSYNSGFGEMVGTGSNYFATLFLIGPFWLVLSLILMINPLKQMDIVAPLAPFYLFFTKIACFCHGCCWGIPWKYGLYNHHYDHPGRQVPVQLIEMFCVLVIFVFFVIYRKKAKPGTLLPMYLILYSGARFFIEFFTAAYPDVLGPFNMYQILCVIAIVVGSIMLLLVGIFGEKISSFFDAKHEEFYVKQAQKEEEKASKLLEAKAREIERREKAKLARKKAKAKYKK